MAAIVAGALVQLAQLALIGYGIYQARPIVERLIDRWPTQPADERLIDMARRRGLSVTRREA